jgi:hypothetical protein
MNQALYAHVNNKRKMKKKIKKPKKKTKEKHYFSPLCMVLAIDFSLIFISPCFWLHWWLNSELYSTKQVLYHLSHTLPRFALIVFQVWSHDFTQYRFRPQYYNLLPHQEAGIIVVKNT